jgi:hypothetical protein
LVGFVWKIKKSVDHGQTGGGLGPEAEHERHGVVDDALFPPGCTRDPVYGSGGQC